MEYGDGNMTVRPFFPHTFKFPLRTEKADFPLSQWGPDPQLTPLGIRQAQTINEAWKKEIQSAVPLPQSLYSSPLSRAASTLEITWEDILIENGEVIPLVIEHLR